MSADTEITFGRVLDALHTLGGNVVDGGLTAPPAGAVAAPWTPEQVYQLNRRQDDDRATGYQCPLCGTDLFATRGGWLCARKVCRFRQNWALARHMQPFVAPPRRPS